MRKCLRVTLLLVMAIMVAPAVADDAGDKQEMMGPTGPPEEMKQLAGMIGVWDVAMDWRLSPESEWVLSPGTATCTHMLDGAAMRMDYSGETSPDMPPFNGAMIQCYDRETKMWQAIWIDNMAARISYYTGNMTGDTTTLSGEDIYQGQKMLTRVRTFNQTDSSFDWTMEHSMDTGKTYWMAAKAKYTKHKE